MDEQNNLTPAIIIFWDEEKQLPKIQCDPNVIRNKAFGLAVLKMTEEMLEHRLKLERIASMQQQAQEQMQHDLIAANLKRGR